MTKAAQTRCIRIWAPREAKRCEMQLFVANCNSTLLKHSPAPQTALLFHSSKGLQMPGTERGTFSAYREYLRAGTGFFVSWWFAEKRPSPIFPTIATAAVICLTWMQLSDWFPNGGIPLSILAILAEWLVAGLFISQAEREVNTYFFVVPLVGYVWEKFFSPPTYYRQDTQKMYEAAVHAAVMEVVEAHMSGAKDCRPLTEFARNPILFDFYRKRAA